MTLRIGKVKLYENDVCLKLDEIFPKQLITAKLGGSIVRFLDRDHQLCEAQ